MGEETEASTNKINLLLLMPFACTTRIKEICPQPWPSPLVVTPDALKVPPVAAPSAELEAEKEIYMCYQK